jgi:DNA-binding NarL/FixJ family response regulator
LDFKTLILAAIDSLDILGAIGRETVIRVIAIDDHELILSAISEELSKQQDIELVGTADHGSQLPNLISEKSPDVVLLDLGMAGEVFDPIAAVKTLLQEHPEVRVLILTGELEPAYVKYLVDAGAMGYIFKNDKFSGSLSQAIRAVYNGETFYSPSVQKILLGKVKEIPKFTDQELQVLRLVTDSFSNTRIGDTLGLSEKRVKNIMTDIYQKLSIEEDADINMRVALINKARELGLLLR